MMLHKRKPLAQRYVMKTVILAIALVLLMLTGLQAFILFVNQLGDLGKAQYGISQALYFIGLNIPYQVYLFFPMASLLGCLVGLGTLANHHELVALRASGMSIAQIAWAVLKGMIPLIVLVSCLGELLFPKMVLTANAYKTQILSNGQPIQSHQGVWIRSGQDVIRIESISLPSTLYGVDQFRFDRKNRLVRVRHIEHIERENEHWIAHGVDETFLHSNGIDTQHRPMSPWEVNVDLRMLLATHHEPDEMTITELTHYLYAQRNSHQNVQNYQIAYWQRLVLPLTTMVMVLLAIPCVFGPLRSSSMGFKLLMGSVIGFGFYIANRFCGSLSQIYQFPAWLAAIGPTTLCAMLGMYLMQRR